MKYLQAVIGLIAFSVLISACDDGFLTRTPKDQISSEEYFKKPNDLEAYVNQFYDDDSFPIYGAWGEDFGTDNQVSDDINSRLEGTRVLSDGGGIFYDDVRDINYFFDHYGKVEENADFEEYRQYVGEAHFFRALIYFDLLRSYGDVLWLETTVGPESPRLYESRDPRNVVADNIIADLDTAATYLTAERTDGASRVNRWMALLIQSRVALYEGTWEKYHDGTPFGVDNPQPEKYFNKVVEATTEIMQSGLYDIYSTGNPETDYYDLFATERYNYASNDEVMFWKEFNNELGQGEGSFRRQINYSMEYPKGNGITKQLADVYLCVDGEPITVSSQFEGYNDLSREQQNRDPRFEQTIATPGAPWMVYEDSVVHYNNLYEQLNTATDRRNPVGYVIRKGYDPRMENHTPQFEESPSIIYRYAEVLLNFAEAKAELGTLTQQDINNSIKKLRDRVDMPNLVLSDISNDPEWNFPELSPVINEIRRERRVELAAEGFRWDDIARWAAADELIVGQRPKGLKASQLDSDTYPVDANGFLDPYQDRIPGGYGFKLDRDYLNPISRSEIELSNGNLEQNPGWE
ncbi:Starch-binding associating with outer membrane [Fodinibius roseus]|uniref:Starch-binding associating with outer membrane n=1 Tax=Fodinibius roseus TaxID=1194090 RepID=A0A1M5IQR2_9BACT|nr:RagB/SusD family nutrient uptake outer membrane protein [Fodinibius roseus]SHG30556.1 Starch-binding associating with outer membrane [Fodinibius roseus]